MSSKQTSLPHYGVPDVEIESLLGQGRSYDEWKVRLKNHGYGGLWNENLKNMIIKREFEKFKTEILRLQAEPNEAPSGKDVQKTNSLESILKRLQGQDWANGKPNEKVQRMRDRRLLGKDAKIRALQKYVKEWKEIESSGASSNLDRDMPVAATDPRTLGLAQPPLRLQCSRNMAAPSPPCRIQPGITKVASDQHTVLLGNLVLKSTTPNLSPLNPPIHSLPPPRPPQSIPPNQLVITNRAQNGTPLLKLVQLPWWPPPPPRPPTPWAVTRAAQHGAPLLKPVQLPR
ncbi:hypothetical protein BGZ57DRAFT_326890 [Hyaloscypha finlandica]|nr:hypothetical protein BGZ57DRAFT_326890 [Hyaloscypha finlandica]